MKKTILIVDDDPDIIKYISKVLEKIDCNLVTAKNGEEALDKINQEKPDLITLDLLMPKRSGARLYYELKTSDALKDIPVIMVSGMSEKAFLKSQDALMEFHGKPVPKPAAYIEKPLQPENFIKIVKDILDIS